MVPNIMLLAKFHDMLADVGTKIVSNQDFDVLFGDVLVEPHQEDLFEPGLVLVHIEPAAFIRCEHTAWRGSHSPGVIVKTTLRLVYCHGRK